MQFHDLLRSTHILDSFKKKDFLVKGISYHSQHVIEGHVFVCIRGYKTDGHQFLLDAKNRGATAAIVEEINEEIDIPQFKVSNSRKVLSHLSATFYGNPSKKMKMIGITATNGKTTTSYLLNTILESHGYKTGLIGTDHIKIHDEIIPSQLTTPESLELQGYLNKMLDQRVSHVTMEVSSAAQEMHRTDDVDYDIVTFNNASKEHVDTHGNFANYLQAKSKLIKNARKDSYAILNLECPYAAALIDQTNAQTVTFSLNDRKGDFHCKNVDLSTGRATFTVEMIHPIRVNNGNYIPKAFDITLSIPGLHSVYNSMVAIISALLCGVPVSTIQETLASFKGVTRRFDIIYEDEIKIIDDHFANPGNINVTLETLSYMTYKNVHLVYAIRGNRGVDVNRENAETIVEWASKLNIKKVITTKSKSHTTEKDKVTDDEVNVFIEVMSKADIEVILFDELPEAIETSLSIVQPDDLLLLAGCQGMDPGAEIALQYLNKVKSSI